MKLQFSIPESESVHYDRNHWEIKVENPDCWALQIDLLQSLILKENSSIDV
jgi:hypothetical protein